MTMNLGWGWDGHIHSEPMRARHTQRSQGLCSLAACCALLTPQS